ncbi:binding-protein-dependent transport system innermembrane protein [Pseudoleptotrichia goodfellowii]|uniref:Binding-protein-dependent transport system innermembrane protein n=1 Tax=Pseudoleptotrichia goodfellowii TaxID=157692 RepID=A0A510JC66_9FUSO|nr:binding-protein-dependent transport system innermembrane protein [Pseudoleptotrichia goodfellowii]
MAKKVIKKINEKGLLKWAYYLPISLWMTLFFGLPTLIIIAFSFLKKGAYGGIATPLKYTMAAYNLLFTSNDIIKVVVKTLNISVWITAVTLFLAIPVSYYISRSKYKNLWLLLIVIPFWTNFLVRIFSFIAILGNNGIVNQFLMKVFGLKTPLALLYNKNAVIIISVYVFLPYAILPLYSAIEKFDFSLLDAASDLGANKFQALMRVFIPGIKSGIVTAVIFTLVPAIGSYAVPDLVGGTDGIMLGNIIANRMFQLRDWPTASAISTVFIVITTFGVWLSMKMEKEEEE